MSKEHNGNCCAACCEDNDVCKQTMADISRCLKEHIADETADIKSTRIDMASMKGKFSMLLWFLGGVGGLLVVLIGSLFNYMLRHIP